LIPTADTVTAPIDCPVVFIIGAPRSGTTWLQQMLGAYPGIVTSQETDFFNRYVEPLCRSWSQDLATDRQRRFKGLAAVLTQDEFDRWISESIGAVYRKLRSLKPSASVILEKNPTYSLKTDLIARYVPQARFIHVLRDGRDVVASLLAASAGWGASWAPSKSTRAAKTWRKHVIGAQQARKNGNAYIEVRYEQLLRDGPAELHRVFDFCGLPVEISESRLIYERFTFDRIRSAQHPSSSIVWSGEIKRRYGADIAEPDGFFREGRAGAWPETLTAAQCRAIYRVAGTLLEESGYCLRGDTRWRSMLESVKNCFTSERRR
jgi:hypothetical protein